MVDYRNAEFVEILKNKELKMINKVISKYDFTVIDIKKVRSAYKIETDKGMFCLKRMRHGTKKAYNGNYLTSELKKNNFYNTAGYIKTTDGKFFIHHKGYVFYVTEWINGEECNMNDINETVNCAKLLANFHSACKNIDKSKLYIESNTKNLMTFFMRCVNDMRSYKRLISSKKLKNGFDEEYEKLIDRYCDIGLLSIKLLNESSYLSFLKNYDKKKTICHDSFYYQNIIKKDDKYYIIDLDSIVIDFEISDLGKMIRRLMFKKEYNWDFEKAKLVMEAYMSINKLTREELQIMLAIIIFPHKFWKLGKKRYVKCKNWTEKKYIKRLNKIIDAGEFQDKFIQKYIDYLKKYNYN
ncbi:CotS family spore coat protein [Clostridium guangxiense]|uniref:CotS family spore coat protein n=2 Tax=Clostridium TaxID=1485 RepID=UPI001E3A5810|nr:CotS family spore coat protein [Clostridium guangxiense]MCD2345921.1 CotS family spore coat protein [Clostridium guangxiense]